MEATSLPFQDLATLPSESVNVLWGYKKWEKSITFTLVCIMFMIPSTKTWRHLSLHKSFFLHCTNIKNPLFFNSINLLFLILTWILLQNFLVWKVSVFQFHLQRVCSCDSWWRRKREARASWKKQEEKLFFKPKKNKKKKWYENKIKILLNFVATDELQN